MSTESKLLYFTGLDGEYVVLSTGADPDEEFARTDMQLTAIYSLADIGRMQEWPMGLPTDTVLKS